MQPRNLLWEGEVTLFGIFRWPVPSLLSDLAADRERQVHPTLSCGRRKDAAAADRKPLGEQDA